MPWTIGTNGERVYKVSAFTKEELPTWSEMYEDWYKGGVTSFDADQSDVCDPYWKIPRRMFLMAVACNQLNKMIFEDGYRDKVLAYISEHIFPNAEDIRFTCEPFKMYNPDESTVTWQKRWEEECNSRFLGMKDSIPPIYTIPLPTGEKNPFILDDNCKRVNITKRVLPLEIFPVILFSRSETGKYVYTPQYSNECQRADWKKIVDFMMEDMRIYFEGEGVGWKDENGHLIEGDPNKHTCTGVGADPAL